MLFRRLTTKEVMALCILAMLLLAGVLTKTVKKRLLLGSGSVAPTVVNEHVPD